MLDMRNAEFLLNNRGAFLEGFFRIAFTDFEMV
jgi:hypothetical protein